MDTPSFGKLINNAGKGNYKTPESVKNVIRYITRTGKYSTSAPIAWGGFGILKYTSMNSIIRQFELVQQLNERNNSESRFIDHEYFSFTKEGEDLLVKNNVDLDELAQELAFDFYNIDQCQVIYGVHPPDTSDNHLHIHFGINTYDLTGHKRRENTSQNTNRNARFQNIIAAKVREQLS